MRVTPEGVPMMSEANQARTWRRASASGQEGGNCVEIGSTGKARDAVRDSKNAGPTLVFTSSDGAVAAMVNAVRRNKHE